jgi:hypothetical protein
MSIVYVILINVILIFITFVILNHKINKNSTSALLDRYTREVENLIVELNRAVDDVLSLSEERIGDLKKLIRKAEKVSVPREPPEDVKQAKQESRGGNKSPATLPLYDGLGKKVEIRPGGALEGDRVPKRVAEAFGVNADVADPRVTPPAPVPAPRSVEERRGAETRPVNMLERTRHLLAMGHSKEEIADILGISKAEMDFLASLHNK